MTESPNDRPYLKDASDWATHEDCIVGNDAGLRSLRRAIDAALAEGEYFGSDLGDWVGVKRIDPDAILDHKESEMSVLGKAAAIAIVLTVLAAIGVGLWTMLGWIFGA